MAEETVATDVVQDVPTPEISDDADLGDFGIIEEPADADSSFAVVPDDEPTNDADVSAAVVEKPTEPEPEVELKPEAKADDVPKKPEWDKVRQQKDEELATLRKQNVQLLNMLSKDKGKAEVETPKVVDDELSELGENVDYDVVTETVNRLVRRQKETEARDNQKANGDAYDSILAECDTAFGAEFRNDAVGRMKEIWETEGFGPGRYPDAASTRLAVRGVYAELQNAKLRDGAKAKVATPKKPGIKPDTGRGGAPPRKTLAGMMTTQEAIASMRAGGELKWAERK